MASNYEWDNFEVDYPEDVLMEIDKIENDCLKKMKKDTKGKKKRETVEDPDKKDKKDTKGKKKRETVEDKDKKDNDQKEKKIISKDKIEPSSKLVKERKRKNEEINCSKSTPPKLHRDRLSTNKHNPPSFDHEYSRPPIDNNTLSNYVDSLQENAQAGSSREHCANSIYCDTCHCEFEDEESLAEHLTRVHSNSPRQSDDPTEDHNYAKDDHEINNPDIDEDPEIREIMKKYERLINRPHVQGRVQSEFNFSLAPDFDLNYDSLNKQLDEIFVSEENAFRLNFSLGFILKSVSGELRYFYAHGNEIVLDEPVTVSTRADLDKLKLRLSKLDILDLVFQQRPNTKWSVLIVTNVRWVVTRTSFPLGRGQFLPVKLTRSSSVITMVNHADRSEPRQDNLCVFRCLAYHRLRNRKRLEKCTIRLFKEFSDNKIPLARYKGIHLDELGKFENCFRINVNVFERDEEDKGTFVYRSRGTYDSTMNLALYKNHLMYITKLDSFLKKFQCRNCDSLFNRVDTMKNHEKKCDSASNVIYPGGYYARETSLFQKLENFGINVPDSDRFYPFFITYDFEAILKKIDTSPEENSTWTHQHIPVSFSLASNVPGFENPVCCIDNDPDNLIRRFIEKLNEIQLVSSALISEKMSSVFEDLEETCRFDDEESDSKLPWEVKCARNLKNSLIQYVNQIPVLGFNSSKYDLNLIKSKLSKHLNLRKKDNKHVFVVKKCNQYMCISNDQFKFLDISNFLAPGYSYAQFLESYNTNVGKGFFPYEFLDNFEKLNYPSLPPYESFFSKLKMVNILDETHVNFRRLVDDGRTESAALKILKLKSKPPSGRENYDFLQKLWKDHHMQTLGDLLVFYNNLDVKPFCEAVQKMLSFYIEKGIDLFKRCISVPGVARELVFQSAMGKAHFACFDRHTVDIYETFRKNIVGGPSIVFHRYHEKDVTKIRNDTERCKTIQGWDANALYLWALDQPQACGPFTIRREESNFKIEKRDKYLKALNWMEWLMESEKISIQHYFNQGKEFSVGPYKLDGLDSRNQTAYEFYGCYFHRHRCELTRHITDAKWLDSCETERKRLEKRREYIVSQGYKIIEIWECNFENQVKTNPNLKSFLVKRQNQRPCDRMTFMSQTDILDAVSNDRMFGAVECDIHTPPSLSEKFDEMPPLFANCTLNGEQMGNYTRRTMTKLGIPDNGRRLLVSGKRAKKILLATPLLKWYLSKGLVVTRIYKVIEFTPDRCFSSFVEDVVRARRAGDDNPLHEIIAETQKLIGNSSYGSMLLQKSRFLDVLYCNEESEACLKASHRRFRKLTEIDKDIFEIEMSKKKIVQDLPVQIGFFILNYAKLKMLAFYYDFLDKFISRKDFQLVTMDTDSFYFALSQPTLEKCVKPDMVETFDKEKHLWLPRVSPPEAAKFDRRVPGLFKLEASGDCIVALCSKTYCLQESNSGGVKSSKFSCKGINKRNIRHPIDVYKEVLFDNVRREGNNRGFRSKDNSIFSYTQIRRGFSPFYPKRLLLDDGITTKCLDIELTVD